MYQLATVFPPLQRVRKLPLSRDQLMLLLVAANELFLGFEHYLAHSYSGTIVAREWIPIIYAPAAGLLLLLAGLLASRGRAPGAVLGYLTQVGSIAVGLLGAYFHFARAILPGGPPGSRVTLSLLVWAPSIPGPLFLSLMGVLGLFAVWRINASNSGAPVQPARQPVRFHHSGARVYLLLVALGILTATVSSVMDHARTHFENPWLWVPTAVGVFGTVAAVVLAMIERPSRTDLATFVAALLLLLVIGPLGLALHVKANLTSQNAVVIERFLRGAPVFAPMLFSDLAVFGLVALLNPEDRRE